MDITNQLVAIFCEIGDFCKELDEHCKHKTRNWGFFNFNVIPNWTTDERAAIAQREQDEFLGELKQYADQVDEMTSGQPLAPVPAGPRLLPSFSPLPALTPPAPPAQESESVLYDVFMRRYDNLEPLLIQDMGFLKTYFIDEVKLDRNAIYLFGPGHSPQECLDPMIEHFLEHPADQAAAYFLLRTHGHHIVVKLNLTRRPGAAGNLQYDITVDAFDSYSPPEIADASAWRKMTELYAVLRDLPPAFSMQDWHYHFLHVQSIRDDISCGLWAMRILLQSLNGQFIQARTIITPRVAAAVEAKGIEAAQTFKIGDQNFQLRTVEVFAPASTSAAASATGAAAAQPERPEFFKPSELLEVYLSEELPTVDDLWTAVKTALHEPGLADTWRRFFAFYGLTEDDANSADSDSTVNSMFPEFRSVIDLGLRESTASLRLSLVGSARNSSFFRSYAEPNAHPRTFVTAPSHITTTTVLSQRRKRA